jgi:UDP-N-acetylmuramoyl-tripeptide--D-alanyl-D-alanine ligase
MKLKLEEIISAVGGRKINEFENELLVENISTDTRTLLKNSLFVPIKGENFDGHEFIGQAAENGAICALTERESVPIDMDIPLIYVGDTRRALLDLANFYRRACGVKVVAITGSAGKTTTKDMIAEVLAQKFKVKKTIKNFNNEIGVPLSIFQTEADDEMLVLEMGMNHAGEISELSRTGAPDIAVITHIGDAHIENFENREGILRAKLEIIDGLRAGGKIILNGGDPLLTGEIAAEKIKGVEAIFAGGENIVEAEPQGLQETRCKFNWRGEEIHVTVPIPGAHMVSNALLASVVGIETGVSPAQISAAFEKFKPPEGRLNIFEAADMTIIDDVYNANPASMLEAIKVLCREDSRRRVAVLGDMNELGHVAEARHREVGEFAASSGVNLLISIGKHARKIHEGFFYTSKNAIAIHFETLDEFFSKKSFFQKGDLILVKASRGMQFEKIISKIKE